MAIAQRPRAFTEAREEVAVALTSGGLVGNAPVRVLGVSGTATQYQLSSYSNSSSVNVFLRAVYAKLDALTLIFEQSDHTLGFHFLKSASEKVPNIVAIKSQVSDPVI